MAVRKETEQAGLTVNHPHTTGRIYGGVGCTIAVLTALTSPAARAHLPPPRAPARP